MNFGVFAYNFKHKKTQEGLVNLYLNGYKPSCIFAANPVKLDFYQSKIRIAPKDLDFVHPRKIAKKMNIPYHVVTHNSNKCIELVKKYNLDLGIILGSRIIKEDVINSFNVGILNMHPGLLPENRGLDNLKWAVIDNLKQGVSSHLIDKYVDRGYLIDKKEINVYTDDTLVDILIRLQNLELKMMVDFLDTFNGDFNFKKIGIGKRNKSLPTELENNFFEVFETYKKNYKNIEDVK